MLDKNTWTYPDDKMINLRDEGVKENIVKQYKSQVRYTVLEYSTPPLEIDIDDGLQDLH